MSEVFFISDLHFGHKRIVEHGQETGIVYRSGADAEENKQIIISNWNKTVGPRDTIYVHGDVAFDEAGFNSLKELAGTKILIRGNHDDKYTTAEWLTVFKEVYGIIKYKDFWLTHAPVHPQELRGKRNIHGHVHQHSIKFPDSDIIDPRYISVCCETIGETPISLTQIKDGTYDRIRKC